MGKPLFGIAIIALVLVAGVFVLNSYAPRENGSTGTADYRDAEYTLGGQRVKLEHGVSETEAAPGSASKTTTRYFGNDLRADLDGDGREDVAFLLTQEPGGSGSFFYVVAALNTDHGYVGSDGYLLGDRVAPRSLVASANPGQKNVVIVNYADRVAGEPMTSPPTVGTSAYLKLDPATMRWGIVEPDPAGEAR